jgi:hypothetical protein
MVSTCESNKPNEPDDFGFDCPNQVPDVTTTFRMIASLPGSPRVVQVGATVTRTVFPARNAEVSNAVIAFDWFGDIFGSNMKTVLTGSFAQAGVALGLVANWTKTYGLSLCCPKAPDALPSSSRYVIVLGLELKHCAGAPDVQFPGVAAVPVSVNVSANVPNRMPAAVTRSLLILVYPCVCHAVLSPAHAPSYSSAHCSFASSFC